MGGKGKEGGEREGERGREGKRRALEKGEEGKEVRRDGSGVQMRRGMGRKVEGGGEREKEEEGAEKESVGRVRSQVTERDD